MLQEGYLKMFVGSFDQLGGYWQRVLLDYPQHPAAEWPHSSIPLTLYGASLTLKQVASNIFRLCIVIYTKIYI